MRAVHAFGWLWGGTWAILMGFWQYTTSGLAGHRWSGFRETFFQHALGHDPSEQSAYEEGVALVALSVWFCGLVLAAAVWRGAGSSVSMPSSKKKATAEPRSTKILPAALSSSKLPACETAHLLVADGAEQQ